MKCKLIKLPSSVSVFEKGESAILIRSEQANKVVSKNATISKPREAPKIEKTLGRKVVLEKGWQE